jgi:hypothetical protein
LAKVRQLEEQSRQNQKLNFDIAKKARPLSLLKARETVWVKGDGGETTGTVVTDTQQSGLFYMIETPKGSIRRNRRHLAPASILKDGTFASDSFDQNMDIRDNLIPVSENASSNANETVPPIGQDRIAHKSVSVDQNPSRTTRSGLVSKPVDRLNL